MSSGMGYETPREHRSRRWTDKDVRLLRKYASKGITYCSRELNRSVDSIKGKARALGIPITSRDLAPNAFMPWSDNHLRQLELNYPRYGPRICAERLGRTILSVKYKAAELGLSAPNTRSNWTEEEEQCVWDNYELAGAVVIATMIDRSIDAIYRKAQSFGLKRRLGVRNHHTEWTAEEEELVQRVVNLLAVELGRSPAGIVGKARRLVADKAQWPGGTVVPPKRERN